MKEDGTPEYRYNHHLIGTSAPIKDNANRVTNGSFEFGLSNDGWSLISVDSFGSYSRVTAESILDNYSAKISSTSEEETYLQQMITLDAGVYTLSGFVFNETLNNEVFLSVNGHSYGGVVSKVVNNQEWVENKVRFVVEENNTNVYIRLNNNSTGAAYFDGVQVYEGFGENIPNLLENPSFEDIESNWIPGWEDTTTGEVELVSSGFPTESYLDFLGSNAIKIYGNPVQGRSYEIDSTNGQRINISSDVFTVGGWALTEGTPVSKSDADAYNRFFRIKVGMYDVNDSQVGDYLYVDFDSTIDGWQFNNSSFEVETGTSYLRLWVEYQGEGYVLFDNLSVYNGTLYTRYFYSEDTSGAPEVIIVEPSGDETVYTYDSSDTYSNVPMMISADGETTTISKDSKNNIQTITNDNVTTEFSSNDDGVTTGLSLESGATEYMSFSTTTLSTGFGQYTQSFTDEFGAKTKFYDDMVTGLLEAIENSEGIHTKYVYDDYGNIERVEITDDYTSSTSNVFGYTVYGYDTEGRINKIWLDYDENPNMYYEIVYDSSGRMDKVKIGTTILMDYDYKSKPYGYETNLVEKQTYGNLDEMSFSYDTRDRLESISFKESNETNEKLLYKYLYDEQDRISVKEEYDPNDSETVVNRVYYGYDISGRITRIYDEKGNDYVYGYDIDGNLSTLDITVDNDIEHKTTYSYGDSDRTELVSVVNINGVNVRQDYIYSTDDALERLNDIQTTYGTDLIIEKNFLYDGYTDRIDTITYDLTTASGADVKYEYTYYDNGNIRYVRYYSDNMSTPKTFHGYSYDELDQLEYVKSRDYSVGDTTFTDTNNTKFYYYDDRGNIIETKTFLFTQMDTFTPSNVTTNLQNYGLEPAEVFHSNGTHYTVPVQLNLNDNFDPLVDMDYTFLHEPSQTDITGYMSNQLCTSNLNTSIENNYYVQCEVYDDWGDFYFTFQIKIIVGNPVSGPRTPIESMSYTYDQDWIDLLTSYDIIKDGTTYRTEIEYEDADGNATYDPQGTPKVIREYEDTTLVRLIELSWSGRDLTTYKVYGDELKTNHISTLTFKYNDEGIRTSKSYEDIADPTKDYTVEYTLIDDRVIYETDGDYGIFYTYDENGIIISFNYDSDVTDQVDGQEYFYIRNLQGDVTAITDSSGAIVVEYKYDSFGNIVDTSVGSGYEEILEHNSYTYRGYRQDKETNWYYLQSRYYNAETGRFINSDVYIGTEGLPQSTNIFAYTFNNPINYIDPNGDWGFTIRINWKTSTVANIIDIAIAAAGLIAAVGSFTVLVKLIKAGRKMIYTKIKKALISAGLAIATSLLNTAFSVINLFSDLSSLGGLVAHGLDYMDGSYDGRIKYRIKIGR
jgi:RHS repeat-associated protein